MRKEPLFYGKVLEDSRLDKVRKKGMGAMFTSETLENLARRPENLQEASKLLNRVRGEIWRKIYGRIQTPDESKACVVGGGLHALRAHLQERYGTGFLQALESGSTLDGIVFANYLIWDDKTSLGMVLDQLVKNQYGENVRGLINSLRKANSQTVTQSLESMVEQELLGEIVPLKDTDVYRITAMAFFPPEIREACLLAGNMIMEKLEEEAEGNELNFFALLRKISWRQRTMLIWFKFFDACEHKLCTFTEQGRNDTAKIFDFFCKEALDLASEHIVKIISIAQKFSKNDLFLAIEKKCEGKIPDKIKRLVSNLVKSDGSFSGDPPPFGKDSDMYQRIILAYILYDSSFRNFHFSNDVVLHHENTYITARDVPGVGRIMAPFGHEKKLVAGYPSDNPSLIIPACTFRNFGQLVNFR